MARLAYPVLLFALAIGLAPAVLAGPACARRLQGDPSCMTQCGKRWGWPGRTMGDDPWGNVVKATVTDMASGSITTKQCKLRPEAVVPVANAATFVPSASVFVSSSPPALLPPSGTPLIVTSPSPSPAPTSHATANATSIISSSATSHDTPRPSPTARTQVAEAPSSAAPHSSSSPPPPPPPPSPTPEPSKAAPPPSPPPPPPSPPPPPPPPTTSARPSPSPTPVSNPSNSFSGSSGGTSNSDIAAYLSAHNSVRAQHGAAALTWSDSLASTAQQWANGCVFKHSGGTLGPFGENLAAGTGSAYDIAAAVKSWTDEVSQYDPNNPVPSHFTQVVWKGTSQVGCAVQSCDGIFAASFGKAKYFVCEYSAQGNIIGEFAQNVQK